uniref:TonB-dependent receptor n=1 Tax=uncultured Caulobacter sp. TaxID=158749 RepID=UPI0025ED8C97|nr:TonB-dependent receptor [uncultured Caulobacter sp.]
MSDLKRRMRRALTAGVALAALWTGVAAAQSRPVRVQMPTQPMDRAIEQLAKQSGVDILFTADSVKGLQAPGLSGEYDAETALRRLVQGSPLVVTHDSAGALIVRRRRPSDAPETTSALDEPVLMDDVVVTGIANSLAQALDQKRRATNVIDVVKAEDIGKFPAQNIAEALQRVPGVSIVRDRGEGVFVRVRGLGPSFDIVTLNGRTAAVNENVRDGGTTGRQFRFDTFASELVSAVEVIKSPNASLDEGGIAGIVNMRTFRPLDFKGPTVNVSATGSYSQLADKGIDPRLSGLAAWQSKDGNLGLLASAVYDERSVRQDRIIQTGWTDGRIDANGDGVLDPGTILVPTANRPTLEQEQRKRIGLTGGLQWRPSDNLQVNLDALWSRLRINYDEMTYSSDFQTTALRAIVPGTAVITDGVLTHATVQTNTQIGREVSKLDYQSLILGGNVAWTKDKWTVNTDLTYSRAYSNTPSPITRSRLLGPVGLVTFDYALAGERLPNLNFAANLNDPGLLPGRRIEYRVNDSLDREAAAKLDVVREFGDTGLTSVRFGAKIQDRGRNYHRRDLTLLNGIVGVKFPIEFFNPFPVKGFLGSVDGDLPRSWLQPRPDKFLAASTDLQQQLAAPLTRGDLRNSYEVKERIGAGYGMAEFNIPLGGVTLRGDLGLRYANTRQTSNGYLDNGVFARPVSFARSYGNWLPSFNLAAEVTDDFQMHFAASKVITRPALADIAPRLSTATSTQLTAAGGNPDLKPFEAWQYDATAEWYFAPSSALIGGVFYKDITTFVFAQTKPFVIDGVTYLLTAPQNGGGAYVYGAELAYQQTFKFLPAPFDGLGFLANYTHTESQGTYSTSTGIVTKDDLVDVAKDSFSATAFYEKNGAAIRLTYSWRGNVLRDVGGAGLAATNDKAFGSLDYDISYDLTPKMSVSFQGINLTKAVQWNYVRNDRFAGYTNYGRTFLVGLRARF